MFLQELKDIVLLNYHLVLFLLKSREMFLKKKKKKKKNLVQTGATCYIVVYICWYGNIDVVFI